MSIESLAAFIAAALIVLLIPGPGVLYVVTRSLTQGRRAGLISVLGLCAGALVHVFAGAVGLSALLMASATAFGVLKIIGVIYLVYLGLRAVLSRGSSDGSLEVNMDPPLRIFLEGALVSVLNPKIAAFFLAFLPQFIAPEQGGIAMQFVLLGLLYVGLAFCTDGTYALCASTARRRLSDAFLQGNIPKYLSGLTYVGLVLSLALTERRS